MANYKLRLPENTPGKFFVDSTCVACDVCLIEGAKYFKKLSPKAPPYKISPVSGIVEVEATDLKASLPMAYVFNQPSNKVEEAEFRGIMEICPTESIGEK